MENSSTARGLKKANISEPEPGVRELAAEILSKVETRQAYADILLDHAFHQRSLQPRDRGLLTELVYETLRWRARLDGQLTRLVRLPLRDSDPYIRNLLRMALYQMSFLDRIPSYAAVSESVELAKRHGKGKTGGFVNGVLRNFIRRRPELEVPDITRSSTAAIAEYWSHPEWLVHRWLEHFGPEETEALLAANNEEPPRVIRNSALKQSRNTLLERLRSEGVEAEPTHWSSEGISLHTRRAVPEIPGFIDGVFQVQGEASQLVGELVGPQPGERILDACAAPGGKTTHIAELMNDTGEVIALDLSPRGVKKIEENAARLSLGSVRVFKADASLLLPAAAGSVFDRILVDAPCSGFGTLRSHPEIKWNRDKADIGRLAALQARILTNVASYLKPGGVLIYSTCTLIQEENDRTIQSFLESHREFTLEPAAEFLQGNARSLVSGSFLLALPHKHNTDGFFAARMRKLN